MSGISTGVGLVSGLNIDDIVGSLIAVQRRPVARLENRVKNFEARDAALKILKEQMLTIAASAQQLSESATFRTFTAASTDEAQLTASAGSSAAPGSYTFQTVRTAATHEVLSKGFANADQQTIGTGTLTIGSGGFLHEPTRLDALNGGDGVRRGAIRITDRSGATADVDLTNAFTVDDVLNAINTNSSLAITASANGGRLVLTDTSGGGGTLAVTDLAGGHAAEDLGLAKSVAGTTLAGDTVFEITGDFTLDQLNDGNGVRLLASAPDLKITLSDDTVLDVDLDGAASLNDVLAKINDHADNGGKLSAALVGGRLELQDLSGGGGGGTFAVEDVNGAAVVATLGLDVSAGGNTITGNRLAAGINSVLLRNLRGGQGIDQAGQITLTDRTGTTATIDLSGAESLDEVIAAINAAESAGAVKLQLEARINAAGTGVEVRDTSGAAAGNLVIADVGGGTLATQLGIAVDAAQNSIDSGALHLRHVNEATSLSTWSPAGKPVANGSFRITDSAGNSATISISNTAKTVGDVLQRINAASGISVRAELNETGDGFVLIDEAGGTEPLLVEEVGSTTAADLRILGSGLTGGDGKSRISGRQATIVEIEADDTLNDVVNKINKAGGQVTASALNDGSSFNASRLSIKSNTSGMGGRLTFDDGGLGLGLSTRVEGRDALMWSGEPGSGFLLSSSTNTFKNAAKGVDVEAIRAGSQTATVTIGRNTEKVTAAVKSFVSGYNTLVSSIKQLTKFDPETNARGILQGDGVVFRISTRLESIIGRRYVTVEGGDVDSLLDLGIRFDEGGTLALDEERLAEILADDPTGVSGFFLDRTSGFAKAADTALDSFTDPFTGSMKTEENAMKSSVDSLNRRINELDAMLEVRRERLLLQFYRMEEALGAMQSQQQALGSLSNLKS